MDSEDEEWLQKYNKEFLAESDHLSEDNFELMIDALERSYFCDPDDFTDESAAAKYCKDFGRRELAKAVYGYWMKKRKQKRSPLLRVFQVNVLMSHRFLFCSSITVVYNFCSLN
jgi:hypothetical protein